jgi:hypothetical protein
MPTTEIENQPSVATIPETSSPELEEQYRAWAQAVQRHYQTSLAAHEMMHRTMEYAGSDFWRGFGSALSIFPHVVLGTTKPIIAETIDEALFHTWVSVGHDFLSVCCRMTEKSGDPTTTTGTVTPRRK